MFDFAQARTMMVDTQVRTNDVTRFTVIDAMLSVPRELFVPSGLRPTAYLGENLPLAPGRVLLEPRTIGKMLDALDPGPGDLILDVGAGTGYAAALLARIADAVVALEDQDALRTAAEAALAGAGAETVALVNGPLAAGWAAQAPYDGIVITGGAVEEVPDAILAQLREGGRIVALFVEGHLGVVRVGTAAAGQVDWRDHFNAHAPLMPGFARPRGFAL